MDLLVCVAPLDNSFQKDKLELINKGSLGRRRKPSRSNLKLLLSPSNHTPQSPTPIPCNKNLENGHHCKEKSQPQNFNPPLRIESSLPRTPPEPNHVADAQQFSIEAKLKRKNSDLRRSSAVLIQTWERRTRCDSLTKQQKTAKARKSTTNRFQNKENFQNLSAMPDSYAYPRHAGSPQNLHYLKNGALVSKGRDAYCDETMVYRMSENGSRCVKQTHVNGTKLTSNNQEPEWISLSRKLCAKFVEGHIEHNSADSYHHEEPDGVKKQVVKSDPPLQKRPSFDPPPQKRPSSDSPLLKVEKKVVDMTLPTNQSAEPPWIHLSRKLCTKFIEEHIEYPFVSNTECVREESPAVEPNGDVRIIEKIGKPKGRKSRTRRDSEPEWVSLSRKLRAKFIESHIDDPDTIALDNQLNASDPEETSSESLSDVSQETTPHKNAFNSLKESRNGRDTECTNAHETYQQYRNGNSALFQEKECCWEYQEMEFDQESNSGTFHESFEEPIPSSTKHVSDNTVNQKNISRNGHANYQEECQRYRNFAETVNSQMFQNAECYNNDVHFAPHTTNIDKPRKQTSDCEKKVITVQFVSQPRKPDVVAPSGDIHSKTKNGSFFNLTTWEEAHFIPPDAIESEKDRIPSPNVSLRNELRSKSMDNICDPKKENYFKETNYELEHQKRYVNRFSNAMPPKENPIFKSEDILDKIEGTSTHNGPSTHNGSSNTHFIRRNDTEAANCTVIDHENYQTIRENVESHEYKNREVASNNSFKSKESMPKKYEKIDRNSCIEIELHEKYMRNNETGPNGASFDNDFNKSRRKLSENNARVDNDYSENHGIYDSPNHSDNDTLHENNEVVSRNTNNERKRESNACKTKSNHADIEVSQSQERNFEAFKESEISKCHVNKHQEYSRKVSDTSNGGNHVGCKSRGKNSEIYNEYENESPNLHHYKSQGSNTYTDENDNRNYEFSNDDRQDTLEFFLERLDNIELKTSIENSSCNKIQKQRNPTEDEKSSDKLDCKVSKCATDENTDEKSINAKNHAKCNGVIPNANIVAAQRNSNSHKYSEEKIINDFCTEIETHPFDQRLNISNSENSICVNEYANIPCSVLNEPKDCKKSKYASQMLEKSKSVHDIDREISENEQYIDDKPKNLSSRINSSEVLSKKHNTNTSLQRSSEDSADYTWSSNKVSPTSIQMKIKAKSLHDLSRNEDTEPFQENSPSNNGFGSFSSNSGKSNMSIMKFQEFASESDIPLCAKLVSRQNEKRSISSVSSKSNRNVSPCSESSHVYEDMFKETTSCPSDSETSSWTVMKNNSYYVNGRSSSMNDLDFSDTCSLSVKCDYASSCSGQSTLQSRHSSCTSSSFYVNLRDYDSHMLEPSLNRKRKDNRKASSTINLSKTINSNPPTPESLRHLFTSPLNSIHSPPNRAARLVSRMPQESDSHYYSTAAAASSAFKHGFDPTPPKPKKSERSSSIKIKDIAHGIILTFRRFQNQSKNTHVSPTHYVDVSHLAESGSKTNSSESSKSRSKKEQKEILKKLEEKKRWGFSSENGKTDTDSGCHLSSSDIQRAKAKRSSSDLTGKKPSLGILDPDILQARNGGSSEKKKKSGKKNSNAREKGKKTRSKSSEPRTIPTVSRKVQQMADGTLYLVTTVSGDTTLPGVYSDSPDTSSELSSHKPVKSTGESNC